MREQLERTIPTPPPPELRTGAEPTGGRREVGRRRLPEPSRITAAVAVTVLLCLCAIAPATAGAGAATAPDRAFEAIGPDGDWLAQDYADSRGVTSVRQVGTTLVADARLVGGDWQRAKGEVYSDLRYFVGVEDSYLDLRARSVKAVVRVPAAFVGDRSRPNGIQVFVKDSSFRSQYGPWVNVSGAGDIAAGLAVGTSGAAFTAPGFDPSKVRVLGVKIAIGTGSVATFTGQATVLSYAVNPGLRLAARPLSDVAVPAAVFPTGHRLVAGPSGFTLNGRRLFATGGNFVPIEYGQSFGMTGWYPAGNGVSRHPNYIASRVALFRKARAHVVRVPLVADGRSVLDAQGAVVGYDDRFRADVGALLSIAAQNDVKVELTLVDFPVADRARVVDGVRLGGRAAIFTNPATREQFFTQLVDPMLRRYRADPGIQAVDCGNEILDWLVAASEGGGWNYVDPATRVESPIPLADVRAFVARCVASVRANAPGVLVTVGVGAQFARLAGGLGLDYLAIHHYPYMGRLAALVGRFPAGPWSLEEYPTSDAEYAASASGGGPGSLPAYLDDARRLGAAGGLLWSLNPGQDGATAAPARFAGILTEHLTWCRTHPPSFCV